MNEMQDGQRVEVLLHRRQADVWYAGTVVDARRRLVELDSGTEHLGEDAVADQDTIADWRPMTSSPDAAEV